MNTAPLEGIRVIEFGMGQVTPGLTRVLADFGAEVIKVESRIALDFMRQVGEGMEKINQSPGFNQSSRNKKSLTLNMKSPQGLALAKQLIALADVVVENYRGGVFEGWGLDYQAIREIRPDIILLSAPGLGNGGPRTPYETFGPNLPPIGGLTYLWNHPGAPVPIGSQIIHPDFFAALQFAIAVLAALEHRRQTGQGQYIDASQVELIPASLGPLYLDYTVNGRVPLPKGNHGRGAPGGVYRCKGEDKWCAITVENEEEWVRFCEAVGRPKLAEDARFDTILGRVRHADELDALVESWTAERTPDEVMHTLQEAGVAAGACFSAADLFEDRHIAERGFIIELDHPEADCQSYGGVPMVLSATPATFRAAAPLLGQHNEDICRELLGLSDKEIQQLTEARVLF